MTYSCKMNGKQRIHTQIRLLKNNGRNRDNKYRKKRKMMKSYQIPKPNHGTHNLHGHGTGTGTERHMFVYILKLNIKKKIVAYKRNFVKFRKTNKQ